MRNLKKILALVLALVMSFSVMTVSSAAFKDEANISENYAESVEVLSAIGVFRGDEAGKFNPQKSITRAEVAAIIYRITTGDVEDVQAAFYADLNMFTDVTANDWFAGYVNYCASAEYIKGRGNGTFDPNGKITGYDAMTMILRAIGRDQNGEFVGEGYTVKVAEIAKECGITKTLKNVALGSPATREVIAEILLRTMLVPQFSYTLSFGYSVYKNPLQQDGAAAKNLSLGMENFGLYYADIMDRDAWGVPYTIGYVCNWYDDLVDNDGILTSSELTPVFESFEAAYECDIAKELGITSSNTFYRVTENATNIYDLTITDDEVKDAKKDGITLVNKVTACGEFDGTINATSTKTAVGAQGRWTRIFLVGYDAFGAPVYEMVMMDQFLGQVTDVTEITYDRNGHVINPARVFITVYDDSADNVTEIVWASKSGNFEYEVGEFILMNHEADKDGEIVFGGEFYDLFINLGAPEALNGKQTAFVYNRNSHIVNDEEYNDAYRLYLDQAGTQTTEHIWLFDTLGNLIGIVDPAVVDYTTYGVITAIKWIDDYTNFNNSYALANIVYIDGTSSTLKINFINGYALEGSEGIKNAIYPYAVSSSAQYNEDFLYHTLYAITTDSKGRVHLDDTTLLTGAYTATGAPELGESGYFAGKTTKFLVLTDEGFETYTGYQNIPSYVKGSGYYWAVDAKGTDLVKDDGALDFVAEYVYIITPEVAGEDVSTTYGLYFAHENDKLTVKHYVKNNGVQYWSISGALVDGEIGTIYTADEDIKDLLIDTTTSNLMYLTYADGFVVNADYVTENWYYSYLYKYIDGMTCNAVYAGNAKDAYIVDDVLFANGETYDVENVQVISEKRTNLADIIKFAKATGALHEEAYLYIVYTRSNDGAGNKLNATALTIYVSTDVKNVDFTDVVDKYVANVEAAQADLAAAVKALEDATSAAAKKAPTVEDLIAAVEAAQDAVYAAINALDAVLKNIEAAAKIDSSLAYAAAVSEAKSAKNAAYAEINDATEVVIEVEVSLEIGAIKDGISVDVVYTVEDDAAAIKVAAVKAVEDEVLKLDNIAALIKAGYTVKVGTPADLEFELAEGTVDAQFAIFVTDKYTETVIVIDVEVNVTFDDGKDAE